MKNNKQRGNRFERLLVNTIKEHGLDAKRAYASNGESLGLHKEVDIVLKFTSGDLNLDKIQYTIQAKKRKKLPAYLLNQLTDFVVFSQDKSEPLVLLKFTDLLRILNSLNILFIE